MAPAVPCTLLLALSLASLACGGGVTEPASRPVPDGTWAGPHVVLTVSAQGASLEYDCARGSVDEPLVTDGAGRFDARGTHVKERPGPVREGEPPDAHAARYSGRVDGRSMTLAVTLTASGEPIGSFRLMRGAAPVLHKCL